MTIGGTFAGVTAVTEVTSANAQAQIIARINLVKALIKDPESPTKSVSPDFDHIHPNTARLLRAELDALSAAVDAAPTA